MALRRLAKRTSNALRKLRTGLRPGGENICPDIHNDLYYAHLSIYSFASRYVAGARVLDLGCGAGYAAPLLIEAGAREVVGLDIDPLNVRFARRRYAQPTVSFLRGSAEHPPSLGAFDVVVSSNVFEHLRDLEAALRHVRDVLSPAGRFILAVPPIVDRSSLAENQANPHHRANYFIHEWLEHLRRHWTEITTVRHSVRDGVTLDFSSPFEDRVLVEDFVFTPVEVERYDQQPTITAIFVARASRSSVPLP